MIDYYQKVPDKRLSGMGMGSYEPFVTATYYSAFTGLLYLCNILEYLYLKDILAKIYLSNLGLLVHATFFVLFQQQRTTNYFKIS